MDDIRHDHNHFDDLSESISPALKFKVIATCGRARASELTLPHKKINTPVFMPVGTQGTVKGLTTRQLEELGCGIILGNTYHLGHRPGPDVMEKVGGLHKFMNWQNNLLTDSGGFQMVSLLKFAEITEQGVRFTSPHDGTELMLTPEESMRVQNAICADIMMALDDVIPSTTTGPRVEEATHRTLRWIDRCIEAHKRPREQNLFGIVQGGLEPDLRAYSLTEMKKRNLPGYAIGGLSGGESKDKFWRVVDQCTTLHSGLPFNKPRYLMGVGYAVDLVTCTALGVDMFDCVYPSRTARFGTALVPSGTLNLKLGNMANDYRPIDEDCTCTVCKTYTRAYLHVIAGKERVAAQLLTYHNIAYQMRLMHQQREAIIDGSYKTFVRDFMLRQFPKKEYPQWSVDALTAAGIDLY